MHCASVFFPYETLIQDIQYRFQSVCLLNAYGKAVVSVCKLRQEQGIGTRHLIALQAGRHTVDINTEAAQRKIQPASGGFHETFFECPQFIECIIPHGGEKRIEIADFVFVEETGSNIPPSRLTSFDINSNRMVAERTDSPPCRVGQAEMYIWLVYQIRLAAFGNRNGKRMDNRRIMLCNCIFQ